MYIWSDRSITVLLALAAGVLGGAGGAFALEAIRDGENGERVVERVTITRSSPSGDVNATEGQGQDHPHPPKGKPAKHSEDNDQPKNAPEPSGTDPAGEPEGAEDQAGDGAPPPESPSPPEPEPSGPPPTGEGS